MSYDFLNWIKTMDYDQFFSILLSDGTMGINSIDNILTTKNHCD